MKSISKIRQNIKNSSDDGRKQELAPRTSVKTLSNLRDEQIKGDDAQITKKRLTSQSRALQKEIEKKNQKLNDLTSEIEKRTQEAEKSGENIIEESKKRANKIISEAGKEKNEAEQLILKSQKLEEQLKVKEEDLKKLSLEIEQSRISVSRQKEVVEQEKKASGIALEDSVTKLKEVTKIVDDLGVLYSIAVDDVEAIKAIYSVAAEKVSNNALNNDKIYTEIQKLSESIKADKEYNLKRAKELDDKETWIRDRYASLKSSINETRKKQK